MTEEDEEYTLEEIAEDVVFYVELTDAVASMDGKVRCAGYIMADVETGEAVVVWRPLEANPDLLWRADVLNDALHGVTSRYNEEMAQMRKDFDRMRRKRERDDG